MSEPYDEIGCDEIAYKIASMALKEFLKGEKAEFYNPDSKYMEQTVAISIDIGFAFASALQKRLKSEEI